MNLTELIEQYPWSIKTIRIRGFGSYNVVDWVALCIKYETGIALAKHLGCGAASIGYQNKKLKELDSKLHLSTRFLRVLEVKRCGKCRVVKELEDFNNNVSTSDNLQKECKDCAKALGKAWRQSDHGKALSKAYRESDHGRAVRKAWRQSEHGRTVNKAWRHSDQGKAVLKAYRESDQGKAALKKYSQSDKAKVTKKAYSQTEKAKAASRDYFQSDHGKALQKAWRQSEHGRALHNATSAKYRAALLQRIPAWADLEAIQLFYANYPPGYHVDHIVPLQGERVSGLHVLENLQYLTAAENLKKGNKFDLDLQR